MDSPVPPPVQGDSIQIHSPALTCADRSASLIHQLTRCSTHWTNHHHHQKSTQFTGSATMRGLFKYAVLLAAVSIATFTSGTAAIDANATLLVTTTTTTTESAHELDSVAAQLCGLDIVGYDVANYKSSNPDGCLIPCYMRVRDSNAATWTDHDGGTCWCKKVPSGWSFLAPKAGAVTLINSRPLPAPHHADIVIWAWSNRNIPGNDIGNVPAKDYSACSNECLKWDRCFAHTWTNYNGGTCWMKSKVSPWSNEPRAISGYVARQFVKNGCRQ